MSPQSSAARPRVHVDLHLHSRASADCNVDPHMLAKRCQAFGLAPLFLTDHDTVDGIGALASHAEATVVMGEEITTRSGDLIGLFLQSRIRPGASVRETVHEIHEQGGLVYLPHPCDSSRFSLSGEAIDRISDGIDIIEIFNGRATTAANEAAEQLCRALGAVAGAGSDAHSLKELGATYVDMEAFNSRDDFLHKLAQARIIKRPHRLRLRWQATVRALGRSGQLPVFHAR